MGDFENIKSLITSNYSCVSINTIEEQYALDLIRHAALELKQEIWVWSVSRGLREGLFSDSAGEPNTTSPPDAFCYLTQLRSGSICVVLDVADYLKDTRTLRCWREAILAMGMSNSTMIMIDSSAEMPSIVKSYCKTLELSMPGPEEILQIIRETLRDQHNKAPVELGITKKGLESIVRNLRGLARRQIARIITDSVMHDRSFNDQDITEIITAKRNMIQHNGLLEFVQAPMDVNEIGGMHNIKQWLRVRKDAFGPDAAKYGIRAPKGMLILGVQGSGKSLCAKAIASAWQMPLLRLEPGVLYNKFIGESERNLREALKYTEVIAPVVLWIDEIEKAFASAASHSVDGGLSQRMFGAFLTWMQERQSPVFIVATANDIEALPPELLRKGRFDEIFFVDLPGHEARKQIFEIHIRKLKRDHRQFDLEHLAKSAHGYSGAEIEQAIMSAMNEAFAAGRDIDTHSVLNCLKNSPPISVTMAESIQELQEWAKGRCLRAE